VILPKKHGQQQAIKQNNMKYIDPSKIIRKHENAAPVLPQEMVHTLYETLKPHAAYLVAVAYAEGNPVHEAILLTGLPGGNYWYICSSSYEGYSRMKELYLIQIIKPLHVFSKKYFR
jgi:hypothetical protein